MMRFWFAFLYVSLCCFAAQAHEVRPGYINIKETEATIFTVSWKQPVRDGVQSVAGLGLRPVFPLNCERKSDSNFYRRPGALIEQFTLYCENGLMGKNIGVQGLQKTITDIFVRFTPLVGDEMTLRLTPRRPIAALAGGGAALQAYFMLGVEHLLFGFDHILFVIGLILLVSFNRTLFWVITAFTLAHSLTLALSILDIFRIPTAPMEAVIALSILFVAVELTRPPEKRSYLATYFPQSIAFGFGLLHGFGFAGVLCEIGLPRDATLIALGLFNIGLEAGQLLIVGIIGAGIYYVRKLKMPAPYFDHIRMSAVLFMGMVSAYWLLDRSLKIIS